MNIDPKERKIHGLFIIGFSYIFIYIATATYLYETYRWNGSLLFGGFFVPLMVVGLILFFGKRGKNK